jgi:lipopolysaccharide transport system ATP-binding protein
MPGIEAFAELGSYFDEPLRTYSSGMQMRLAFAVATASPPELLIVDEALAVGDSYFQHKCINRIREFQASGTSLLLVSHSPEIIRALCQRGIMLNQGKIAKMGDAISVMDYYKASQVSRMENPSSEQPEVAEDEVRLSTRDSKYILTSKTIDAVNVEMIGEQTIIHSGDKLSIRVTAAFDGDYVDPHIGIGIRTKLGIMVYEANTFTLQYPTRPVSAGDKLTVSFKFNCRLGAGTYELVVGVANKGFGRGQFEQALFFDQSFLIFEVVEGMHFNWSGIYDIQPELEME